MTFKKHKIAGVTEKEKLALVEEIAFRAFLGQCDDDVAVDRARRFWDKHDVDKKNEIHHAWHVLDAAGYWRLVTIACRLLHEMDRQAAIRAMINGDRGMVRQGLHAELAGVLALESISDESVESDKNE